MNIRSLFLGTWFTIIDELHHKSFYILTTIAILFTFMLRGCFAGNYVVNGEQIDGLTVGWHASIVGFHIIALGGLVIAILLSMRSFLRDRDNGMTVTILSKPVRRVEYVTGKVIGIWVLSYGLTLILHFSVYLIMLLNTGARFAWFIPASLVTSLSVLAMVVIVLLLTLFLPDVLAALIAIAIASVSFIVDSIFVASQTDAVQNIVKQVGSSDKPVSWIWIAWPKIIALQYYATSLIKQSGFHVLGPLHPAANVVLYIIATYTMLLLLFRKRDVV